MPTIVYCYSEPVVCEISTEEYERRSNMPKVIEEETGRMARRYIREYDEVHAEMIAEKDVRAEKFRKTHNRCKKSKNATPADRKRNKMLRIRKLYGLVFEDGKGWYYEYGSTGFKQTTEPDSEIFRNLKIAEMEKDARADMDNPYSDAEYEEHRIGRPTLSAMINRLYKQLSEMRKSYEARGYECFMNYYYYRDAESCRLLGYYNKPYYEILYLYEDMVRWQQVLFDKKLGVDFLRKYGDENLDYFCERGQQAFNEAYLKMHPVADDDDDGWEAWREYLDARRAIAEWKEREVQDFLWENSIHEMGLEVS